MQISFTETHAHIYTGGERERERERADNLDLLCAHISNLYMFLRKAFNLDL